MWNLPSYNFMSNDIHISSYLVISLLYSILPRIPNDLYEVFKFMYPNLSSCDLYISENSSKNMNINLYINIDSSTKVSGKCIFLKKNINWLKGVVSIQKYTQVKQDIALNNTWIDMSIDAFDIPTLKLKISKLYNKSALLKDIFTRVIPILRNKKYIGILSNFK